MRLTKIFTAEGAEDFQVGQEVYRRSFPPLQKAQGWGTRGVGGKVGDHNGFGRFQVKSHSSRKRARVRRAQVSARRLSDCSNGREVVANLGHKSARCVLLVNLAPVCHARYRDKPRGIIDEINDSPVTDSNAPLIPVAS